VSDYREQWTRYRFLRNLVLVAFVGAVPLVLLVGTIPGNSSWVEYVQGTALGAWFLGFVVAAVLLQTFRCPRCGKSFFQRALYHNAFAQKCMNCGLAKYSNG
jgi:hypothetical protein